MAAFILYVVPTYFYHKKVRRTMHDAIVSYLLKVKVTGSHYQRNKTLAQQNYEKFKERLHTNIKDGAYQRCF